MTVAKLVRKVRQKRNFPPPEVRRNLRERAGLTQTDVAGVLGTDRASVSRYECGAREPSGETLRRYADLLDMLTLELAGKGGGQA